MKRSDALPEVPLLSGEPTSVRIPDGGSALWSLGCCDCGMFHQFVLSRSGDEIEIRAYRDDFMTVLQRARVRKGKGKCKCKCK